VSIGCVTEAAHILAIPAKAVLTTSLSFYTGFYAVGDPIEDIEIYID